MRIQQRGLLIIIRRLEQRSEIGVCRQQEYLAQYLAINLL